MSDLDLTETVANRLAEADGNSCFGAGTSGATAELWEPYRDRYRRLAAAAVAEIRSLIAAEIEAEAARLDANTITQQSRGLSQVMQIRRDGVMSAAVIARGDS